MVFIYLVHNNLAQNNFQWPLWLNYIVNIAGTVYLVYAKIRFGGKKAEA